MVTINFKDVAAKDALITITKLGNYGFIYVPSFEDQDQNTDKSEDKNRLITVSFKNEKYDKVLNSILMASGLQGKKEENIIFAGQNIFCS